MYINKDALSRAADRNLIARSKVDELWAFLESVADDGSDNSDTATLFWYSGVALTVLALTVFSQQLVEHYTGMGLSLSAVVCAGAFAVLAWTVRARPGLRVLYGLLVTGIVLMAPIFVAGLQIADRWSAASQSGDEFYLLKVLRDDPYPIALAAIFAAAIALRFSKFLFLAVPITLGLWAIVAKQLIVEHGYEWKGVTLSLALLTILATWLVDLRSEWNFGFWIHKCAMLLIAVPVAAYFAQHSEAAKLLAALISLAVIVMCMFLRRPSGVWWGACGVFGYIGHIVFQILGDPTFASLVLAGIGFAMVLVGLRIQGRVGRSEISPGRFRPEARDDPITFGAA